MITISIIGTAGRKDDRQRLTSETYSNALCCIREFIEGVQYRQNEANVTLVSGGAAWMDHIAVDLFLQGDFKLGLHLPCEFVNGQFKDNGALDFKTNPGGTANYYHRLFSKKTGKKSLNEIQDAIYNGAEFVIGDGFHGRNTRVAKSDFLIAATYGSNGIPKDGGTADTCRKYIGNNGWHLSLLDYKFRPLARI